MRVVLFKYKWTSLISLLIGIITGSVYTHAGIIINGRVYEATETRGEVCDTGRLKDYKDREITVFDLPDPDMHGTEWAKAQVGRKYDWKGVFGWVFKNEDRKKFYCFEYVYFTIQKSGMSLPHLNRVSGNTILETMSNERPALFIGKAKDFKI
jgi:uncharacterized protein YycO